MYSLCIISHYGKHNLFQFSSEGLAKKMKEKLILLNIANERDLFIEKLDLIEDEEHPSFNVKNEDFYYFDGEGFYLYSITNLDYLLDKKRVLLENTKAFDQYYQKHVTNEEKWNAYLKEHQDYIMNNNEYPNEVKTIEDFKDIHHKLSIWRPVKWGKEIIKKEWSSLHEQIILLHQQGLSENEIDAWLDEQK